MSEKSRFLTAVRIGVQRLAGTGFEKGRGRRHKHGKIDERTQTFADRKYVIMVEVSSCVLSRSRTAFQLFGKALLLRADEHTGRGGKRVRGRRACQGLVQATPHWRSRGALQSENRGCERWSWIRALEPC
jgi:hypothetical protein